jgi:general secretion pathway protein D
MDQDGTFSKLPENVDDIYQQRIPVTPSAPKAPGYQTVPSGGQQNQSSTAVVTTPVAIEPVVQRQVIPTPKSKIKKTKNTVTTTTIRLGS